LIHTGKKSSRYEYREACAHAVDCGVKRESLPQFEDLPLGGIVGAAELIDCLTPSSKGGGDWFEGEYGFVMARRFALPFRALKGARQFFRVEPTESEAAALRNAGLL
jgi:hypothetical protein